jgi:hypothetical protein
VEPRYLTADDDTGPISVVACLLRLAQELDSVLLVHNQELRRRMEIQVSNPGSLWL